MGSVDDRNFLDSEQGGVYDGEAADFSQGCSGIIGA
jgi:hypothetical protein